MEKRFTEAQIVGFVRFTYAGMAIEDVPEARVLGSQLLPLAEQVRRH